MRSGSGNGVVRATAGAGKTSTLLQVAASLPTGLHSCFLAFGRDAAAELGRRLPPGIEAMTVHKLGRMTLSRALADAGVALARVELGKYHRLLRRALHDLLAARGLSEELVADCREFLSSQLQLARLNLVDPNDDSALRETADRHGLVPPDGGALEDELLSCLRSVLQSGIAEALDRGLTDFTDMLYLPVRLGLTTPRYDFVCVDEAQDYSALALEFTLSLVDPTRGGRLLFVGDPRQSIYGFAGADSGALERIERQSGATVLPLSITYRCPRSHVELARLLAPEIEAGPRAEQGRVFWIRDSVLEHWAREGDLILCRANAPLVGACLRLARAGRSAFVLGRDLARQLTELSRRALPAGLGNAQAMLSEFAKAEERRLRRALEGRTQGQAAVAERLDLIECLRHLVLDLTLQKRRDGDALAERIERTFGAHGPAVTLSTIHRAKGKEAERVLILYPELLPAPYARTAEALRGEICVQFVALTRAKRDLVFVTEPGSRLEGRPAAGGRQAARVAPPRRPDGSRLVSGSEPRPGTDGSLDQGPGLWQEVLTRAHEMAARRR